MSIFTEANEKCKKMTFDEFRSKVMDTVRQKNYMDLIVGWEKHITFSKFDKGYNDDFYASIHYADSIHKDKEFKMTLYSFSCHIYENSSQFYCLEGHLFREELQAITELTNCFYRNNNRFFEAVLDDYQKEMMLLKERDSDGDGLSDYDEKYNHGTDHFAVDTDGDGISDGEEVASGTDPLTSNFKQKSIIENIANAKQMQSEAITNQQEKRHAQVQRRVKPAGIAK